MTRPRLSTTLAALAAATLSAALAPAAHAIVVYSDPAGTPTPIQNTTAAPDGLNAYVGNYNGGAGVLVAPDIVLTTKHLDPTVGGTFVYNGVGYAVDYAEQIGDTQISLMHLSSPTASAGIALYTADPGVAQSVVALGYGGPAGDAFTGNSASQTGWKWTGGISQQSWGATTTDASVYQDAAGATYLGIAFQPTNGSAIFTGGDSGGGLFVNDAGVWKLAGINWSVDGYFSVGSGDSTRAPDDVASIYDVAGSQIYTLDEHGNFVLASGFEHGYASQIAPSAAFIQSEISRLSTASVPEPASLAILLLAAPALLVRRKRPLA